MLEYDQLARHLGPDQPFYGIQSVGLEGEAPYFNRIEDMAQHYVAAVKQQQPQGPYYLSGWSFGAMVAYEMAVVMTRQNGAEKVHLFLIDPRTPDPEAGSRVAHGSIQTDWELLVNHMRAIFGKNIAVSNDELANLSLEEVLELLFSHAKKMQIIPPETSRNQFQHLFNVFRNNFDAEWHYTHTAYHRPVTILSARDENRENQIQPEVGWRNLVSGELRLLQVPGSHLSIVEDPDVRYLAATLGQCLRD